MEDTAEARLLTKLRKIVEVKYEGYDNECPVLVALGRMLSDYEVDHEIDRLGEAREQQKRQAKLDEEVEAKVVKHKQARCPFYGQKL